MCCYSDEYTARLVNGRDRFEAQPLWCSELSACYVSTAQPRNPPPPPATATVRSFVDSVWRRNKTNMQRILACQMIKQTESSTVDAHGARTKDSALKQSYHFVFGQLQRSQSCHASRSGHELACVARYHEEKLSKQQDQVRAGSAKCPRHLAMRNTRLNYHDWKLLQVNCSELMSSKRRFSNEHCFPFVSKIPADRGCHHHDSVSWPLGCVHLHDQCKKR